MDSVPSASNSPAGQRHERRPGMHGKREGLPLGTASSDPSAPGTDPQRTITALRPPVRITSSGNADLWIAPRTDRAGVVHVLHCTAATGTGFAISLTRDELTRIREAADRILSATPADIDDWLDDAARTIQRTRNRTR